MLLETLQEAAKLVTGGDRLATLVRRALKEAMGPLGNAPGPWKAKENSAGWDVVDAKGHLVACALSADDAALMARAHRMKAVLETIKDAADEGSDVVDGPDGQPRPNDWMRIQGEIEGAGL